MSGHATGRTSWYPADVGEADRELNVELGDEFGPAGPLVMRLMKDLAGQQDLRGDGNVRTGFRVLAKKCHIERDECRRIVERAAAIGALDDLTIDEDGRRFTCRVSGWKADFNRGQSTLKKGDQRANGKGGDNTPPEGDESAPAEDVSPAEGDTSPKNPSTGHNTTVSSNEDTSGARATDPDALPEDLPERLHAVVPLVVERLQRLAAAKGAQVVTVAAVGRVLASLPDRDHVAVADDVEHYWTHGMGQARRMKDVVSTYRNRLKTEPAVTPRPALEALPGGASEDVGDRFRNAPQGGGWRAS